MYCSNQASTADKLRAEPALRAAKKVQLGWMHGNPMLLCNASKCKHQVGDKMVINKVSVHKASVCGVTGGFQNKSTESPVKIEKKSFGQSEKMRDKQMHLQPLYHLGIYHLSPPHHAASNDKRAWRKFNTHM